ncbi:MAG TPA: hypothetical protein VGB99_18445 [Acidobacteriota bacterium]
MNEPGTGEHNSQHQIAFWHEIMGLVIHTLDPTRVVISDQAFTADTNGIFRVTTVGCPTPHQPGCEDVGDSASATANALLDMPDVDAYALHFGQWAFDPKVDDSYDNAMALDEMNAVFSRGTDHLFKANIRPIIADTDAATLDDTGVSCPTNNLPMEETCRAPDGRISERNVGHLDTWVQRALDLGASFNHKDGIGTTDRTSGDKCLIADSRQVLSSIPSEIDQRIDTQALGILASQTHGLGRLTDASFRHPPDWVGIDIRYSGDFASCGQGQCLERYSTTDPNVSFLVTLRNNTTATRSVRLQYRWLTYQRNTDQIFGDAFASGYSEPIDLPPGPFYWLEEPAAVPVPSELVGQLALVLEVQVVNASNTSEVYDTNQLVALNESTLPQFPINECQLPGSLYRAFIPDQPTFPPVIDPGSLEATVYGTSAVLAWAVSDADSPTSVSIALDTVNPPEAVIVSDLESDNFVVDDLAPGTTYYWKVSAFDTGQNATFGAVTSFQVTGPYQNGVVLTRPADGTANVPPTTILEWDVVDPEPDLRFSVYFDACPGGSCPNPPTTLICSNISGTTCNPPPSDLGVPPCIPAQLEDNTQYIWRVVAHGSTPTESMGVFTTGVRQVEHEFQLFSPVNNTVPWEDVRVIWREDSQCFNWDTTRIVYRNEANIGQFWTVLDHPQTSGCFPPPPGESVQFYCEDLPDLEPDAAYQWGVFVPDCTKGGVCCNPNTSTCTGTWSDIGRFTTAGPTINPAPQLSQPANQALLPILEGDTVLFSWTAAAASPPGTPLTYRLEIAINSVPPTPVAVFSNLASTSKVIPASVLAEDDVYTWKVTATAGSTAVASASRTLTIHHIDEWMVVAPGYGATSGAGRASIYYNPDPANPYPALVKLREFSVGGRGGGELLPAVGDVDLVNAGKELVFGSGINGPNKVYIYNTKGGSLGSFTAFNTTENPSGRVHVAVGDVDGSSPGNEIIVGTGSKYFLNGTAPGENKVKVFTAGGLLLASFSPAWNMNPSGEVWVAAGDLLTSLPGDEIVCGPGAQNDMQLLIFNGGVQVAEIYPPTGPHASHPWDMTVAVGDFSPTNAGNEVLVNRGGDLLDLYSQGGTLLDTYWVFGDYPFLNPNGNVNVGAGRVDGVDGHEILAGTGYGSQGYLQVFNYDVNLSILQQVLPPNIYGGEVHVAGNR